MPRQVVVLDLAAGRASVGGTTVAVGARPGGGLLVGAHLIRPISFGERWRLLAGSAGTSIGAGILACASGRSGGDAAAAVLALHLAGARPERAVPGFAAQMERLTAAGWSPRDVFDADADLVDLLTEGAADAAPAPDEWTRIVLTGAGPAAAGPVDAAAAGSVDEVLHLLERDLRTRAAAPASSVGTVDGLPPARGTAIIGEPNVEPDRPAADQAATRRSGDPARVDQRHAPAPPAGGPDSAAPPAEPVRPPRQIRSSGTRRHGSAAPPAVPASMSDPRTAAEAVPGRQPAPPAASPSSPADPFAAFPAPIGPPDPPIRGNGPGSAGDPRADPPGAAVGFPTPIAAWSVQRPPTFGIAGPGRSWSAPAGAASAGAAPTVVRADPAASRVAPAAAVAPTAPDAFDIADSIAALLDEESDLRGLRR